MVTTQIGNRRSNPRQERAPLPALFGEHVAGETTTGDRVRAGVSEAIDGGQQVIALFSVVDSTDDNILLMPPAGPAWRQGQVGQDYSAVSLGDRRPASGNGIPVGQAASGAW